MNPNANVDASNTSLLAETRLLLRNKRQQHDHDAQYHKPQTTAVRQMLLSWFDKNGRSLPWRERFNPSKTNDQKYLMDRAYRVWVSETMAQQTQLATLIPYYNRWMQTFPTLADLSAASIDQVNKLWAGLGYYSRARRLLDGAVKVVHELGAVIPSDAKTLKETIPGVGPYTAGAISSIAFNVRAPLVDGNVVRVFSRLCAIGVDPKSKPAIELYWSIADDLVDPHRPGDFNEALMDLGATVCTPKQPLCDKCPLQSVCMAHAEQVAFERIRSKQLKDVVQGTTVNSHDETLHEMQDPCTICTSIPTTSTTDIEDWNVTRYPYKPDRKRPREQHVAVAIVECIDNNSYSQNNHGNAFVADPDAWTLPSYPGKLLVMRGASSGSNRLLAGMWDFPMVVLSDIDPDATRSSTKKVHSKRINSDNEDNDESGDENSDSEFRPSQKSTRSSQSQLVSSQPDSESAIQTSTDVTSADHRRSVMNTFLETSVFDARNQPLDILHRVDLGTVLHIFSHIRRTMHVEHIVINTTQNNPPAFIGSIGQPSSQSSANKFNKSNSTSNDTKSEPEAMWVSPHDLESKTIPVPKPLIKAMDLFKTKQSTQKKKESKIAMQTRKQKKQKPSAEEEKKFKQKSIMSFLKN